MEGPPEPVLDVAHLAHVELLTPAPDESLRFFTEVMGMRESARSGDSVYLRGWDDYQHHTLKLTAHGTSGVGHVGLRARSPQALQRRVEAIERAGQGKGWIDGDLGYGPAYQFTDPDGHEFQLYWGTEWYTPPPDQRPALKNQAQRFPARGISVRRLDHVNLLAARTEPSRDFLVSCLGARPTEQILMDDGTVAGIWFTFTNKGYDLVYAQDRLGARGRLHHVTYAVDSREEVLRAADICLEHGVFIETGPHKHAIQQTFFLYVYEPGGNRIEIGNAGARLILAPDWETVTWSQAERAKGQAWGLETIESFHTHGTPPVKGKG
jgi:catechol 2,3-dioxygenase